MTQPLRSPHPPDSPDASPASRTKLLRHATTEIAEKVSDAIRGRAALPADDAPVYEPARAAA